MELIIRLDDEVGWKRPFLPIKSNTQKYLLSIKMSAHLWLQIDVFGVGLQQRTVSGAASTTLSITDDPSQSNLFYAVSCADNMALSSS